MTESRKQSLGVVAIIVVIFSLAYGVGELRHVSATKEANPLLYGVKMFFGFVDRECR